MPTIDVPSGPIDYVDTGGDGPVVVLTHGFPMDHRQWRKVVPLLEGARCILPTLPLGGHRVPVRPGTDLSHAGQAGILADFLEALDLRDVTLVMNDWGGPQVVVALGRAERVGAMVLVACEAFDNFPPPQVRPVAKAMLAPGGTWLFVRLMQTAFLRHGARTWGILAHSRLPDELYDAWFGPALRSRAIRRDLRAFATGTPRRSVLLGWSEALRTFDRPALVVWAEDDLMMPREHGARLAELLPQGRLVEVAGARTLIPEDKPEELARILQDFLTEINKQA